MQMVMGETASFRALKQSILSHSLFTATTKVKLALPPSPPPPPVGPKDHMYIKPAHFWSLITSSLQTEGALKSIIIMYCHHSALMSVFTVR
jgi:hypothetical protein